MNNNLSEKYKSAISYTVLQHGIGRKTIQWRKYYTKKLIISKLLAEKHPIAHQIENTVLAMLLVILISIGISIFISQQSLSIFVLLAASATAVAYAAIKIYLHRQLKKLWSVAEPVIEHEIEKHEGST